MGVTLTFKNGKHDGGLSTMADCRLSALGTRTVVVLDRLFFFGSRHIGQEYTLLLPGVVVGGSRAIIGRAPMLSS